MLKKAIALLLMLCMLFSSALAAVSMTLPKSLKTIGEEAFARTTSAEKIVIPEGTLEISARAFAGSKAGEIHLPVSLTSIADDAFEDCDAVLYVQKDSYAHCWCNEHSMNYVILGEAAAPEYFLEGMQLNADKTSVSIRATAKEACTLKVDVLSNDGSRVLQTATSDVAAESAYALAEVKFASALPANFILRAVLVDAKGDELCDPVTNRRYTSAYSDFENQNADDYPAAKRMDFGESGFAVLSDNVIRTNAFASVSNGKYTFASPQTLKAGDIVRLTVNGEDTVIKIGSITKNSNGTVIITEDTDVYLSEIYDVISLDADLESGEASRANNIDQTKMVFSKDHAISVGSAKLSAHTEMKVHLKFIYDKKKFGEDYFDIQLIADTAGTIGVTLAGKIDTWKTQDSPAIQVYNSVVIIPGLHAPAFLNVCIPVNIKAEVGGSADFGFSNSYGYYYNPIDGFSKTESGDRHAEAKIKGEFEIFAGPEVNLTTSLFGKVFARLSGQLGARITGSTEKVLAGGDTANANPDKIHACDGCLDGDVYAQINLRGTLNYKLSKKVSGTLLDIKIAAYQRKVKDYYYSYINEPESIYGGKDSFGMTECMNQKYRITGKTMGMDGNEKSGIPVTFSGSKIAAKTAKSPHKIYLYPGSYHALAAFSTGDVERDFTVEQSAFSLILEEKETVIEGYVRDADTEKPIAGAKVVLVKPNGSTKTTTANAEGYYRFDMLPGGTYSIKYSAPGYFPDSYDNITFAAGTRNNMSMILNSSLLMDEEIVNKVLETMGPTLIKKMKSEDIDISFDFTYYVPKGEKPTYKNGQMQISVEIRSGIKSTWPTYTLDTDTFNAAVQAVLDADVFGMTAEETAELKKCVYKPNSSGRCYYDVDLPNGINLHMNQTPSYEAITYIRHPRLLNDWNEKAWSSSWKFDEMTYASSNRPSAN